MTGGALSACAIADTGPRESASEWGGPGAAAASRRMRIGPARDRRVAVRKP